MRGRIGWLAVATSSAVIVSFVIPLCLLVRTLAEDRAQMAAQQEAHAVAAVVAAAPSGLPAAAGHTAVLMPDGTWLSAKVPGDRTASEQAARSRTTRTAFTQRDGEGLSVLVPVALSSGTAVVRTRLPTSELRHGVNGAWAAIVGLGALLLLASWMVARAAAARIATPLTDLAAVAHRLRDGDFEARADDQGPAEVVDVAQAFNKLARRITELVESERQATADLSHRLRTPITALRLDTDLIADEQTANRLREHVDQLQRAVDSLIKDARRSSRTALKTGCDATALVRERAEYWTPLAEDQQRRIELGLPSGPVRVACSAEDLTELLDNVIDNVFHHTDEGTRFEIVLERGDPAVLTVTDHGAGFADPVAALRRGDSGAGSSGLGLDIARRIAVAAGGELKVGNPPGAGARVEVVLPLE